MEKQTSRPRGGKYAQKSSPKKQKAAAPKYRRRRISPLFLVIPALAVVAVAVLAVVMVDRGSSYAMPAAGKQYYAGSSAAVSEGTQLKVQEDGSVTLEQSGQNNTVNLPIYLDDSRSVVLPQDMVYYEPRTPITGRIRYFSQVDCTASGSVTITREGKKLNFGQGFLYDCNDFFLFLEPVVVSINGYEIEIPPLSYVEAVYGSHIMIFNYDTEECTMLDAQSVVTAQPAEGDYVVSLLGDSMTLRDGSRRLLLNRADVLDPMN